MILVYICIFSKETFQTRKSFQFSIIFGILLVILFNAFKTLLLTVLFSKIFLSDLKKNRVHVINERIHNGKKIFSVCVDNSINWNDLCNFT